MIYLVGALNPSQKNIGHLGLFFPTEWKVIKFMFQTTNQLWFSTTSSHKFLVLAEIRVVPDELPRVSKDVISALIWSDEAKALVWRKWWTPKIPFGKLT